MGFSPTNLGPQMVTAIQGFGAGMSAGGAFGAASAQKAALEGQASLAEINASIAEFSAQQTMLAGDRAASNQLLKTGQIKSAQRASMAANGVDISEISGSTQDVLNSTDFMGHEDALTIGANAVRAAYGIRMQGVNDSNQALMLNAQANGINPMMAGFGSLISNGGQVAASWYKMRNAGLFPTATQGSSTIDAGTISSMGYPI